MTTQASDRARIKPTATAASAAAPERGPASWAAQISARQRVLNGETTAAPTPVPAAAPEAPAQPGPDLSELHQQLREITGQISSLHQPYENTLTALRSDVAAIGRVVAEAMPRRELEALQTELHAISERLDRNPRDNPNGPTLAALERGLAEVRDALHGLTPAENLVGFEEAIRALLQKIEQIPAVAPSGQDPLAFKQLEHAVVSLRGVVSNVASDGALAQLAAEVHGLAGQVERMSFDGNAAAFAKLEPLITAFLEGDRPNQSSLEGSIRQLNERLDRTQLSQGDQLALGALEDRIAKLAEKLDASGGRLNHLDAIERGIADLLVNLEEMRSRFQGQPTSASAAPHLTGPASASSDATTAVPAAITPPNDEHAAARTGLPPNTPLEPGSGVPRAKPGSPAARIAASEAALGNARQAASEPGGRAAAIAAARNAAKFAYLDAPVKAPKSVRDSLFGWIKRPSRPTPAPAVPKRTPIEAIAAQPPASRGKRALKLLKLILITASVAIIIIGAAETAFELLMPAKPSAPSVPTVTETPAGPPPLTSTEPSPTGDSSTPPEGSAPTSDSPTPPDYSTPAPEGAAPAPQGSAPATPGAAPGAGKSGAASSFFDPSTIAAHEPKSAEVTGSIQPAQQPSPRPAAPATHPESFKSDALPTSIGPTLRAAVARKNAAAEYEIGTRFAEGRGVSKNMEEALRWIERAADAGFVPAQFRLASLYEKGDGPKKNLDKARRLYLAAAQKGHAKAMHNLAVVYAEGIDGKPDYKAAARWFRKAASHGIADSQYNLAILYARGIGIETNLAESYKWFALVAAKGDAEAAKKRDEVGERLDQKTLMAAKLAAQTFTPESEPDAAVSLQVPPGGWDRPTATPAKPRHRSPTSAAR